MSIDWITVAAQIANFLVLVWLLKRFLYRPILDGIDAREAEITRRMAEAGEAEKKASAAESDYREQQAELLANRKTAIEQALDASRGARDALMATAREQLAQEQQDRRSKLDKERDQFIKRLEHSGAEIMIQLTRRALRDLADEQLEALIVRHVIDRLKPIAADLKQAASSDTQALATTREPLPAYAREQLFSGVRGLLPDAEVRFETDPDQAHGLILRIGGARIDWTVDSYTDEFTALLGESLASGHRPERALA